MSDEPAFKTPKEKEQEELELRIAQCEEEVAGVLAKWRMRLTVITIYQDGKLVGLEINTIPAKPPAEGGG